MGHRNSSSKDDSNKAPSAPTELNLLNEEFENMKRIADGMIITLARPKDRQIGRQLLQQLNNYNELNAVTVKRDINIFMRFLLRVFGWTQRNQPVQLYRQWYGAAAYGDSIAGANTTVNKNDSDDDDGDDDETKQEMRVWLEEPHSYMAMKSFPDGSLIMYTAIAKDKNAGWFVGGLQKLRGIAAGDGRGCDLQQ